MFLLVMVLNADVLLVIRIIISSLFAAVPE